MVIRIVIFYALTFFFLMLLGGAQQATGLLPPQIGLPQWGPGIAALLMLILFRRDGFKINFLAKEIPILRYVIAALIPLAASLVIYLAASVLQIKPTGSSSVAGSLPPVLLWLPFGALGEELGWRGYLHKKLDPHLSGLVSSLLVGLLWFPIHVGLFANGPLYIFFLAVSIIAYSIVIYALVWDTGFNVLLATVIHMAINLGNLLSLDILNEPAWMVVNGLVWAGIAGLTILRKRELFFRPRSKPASPAA